MRAESSASTESSAQALLLPASTTMDAVTLHVGDLALMSGYYRDGLGLEELPTGVVAPEPAHGPTGPAGGTRVVLGLGGRPLVVLVHTPGLPSPRPGAAGLFHTALLFADQAALATTLALAARHPRSQYVGSADHLVSQAFYFTDPEGNGIELYWDRPRHTWQWRDGQVQMATLALDPHAFLQEHLEQEPSSRPVPAADVGHVHLKVGDIPRARAFYADVLGFEVTADMGTALFVSAGGYHHHLGMNTWSSAGAGPRAASVGLGQVSIAVPGRDGVSALAARLRDHGIPARDDGRTLAFEDPWGSVLHVSAG